MAQLQRLVVAPEQILAQQITLTLPQQHYLGRVLRLRSGDRFIAINGFGQGWLAALTADVSTVEILEPIQAQTELPISVTLLMALPKNGMDDVVRQATELGVDRIVPILSDRTVLKPSPQKLDRWQRIAQEAAEQCERLIVPEIQSPQAWGEALQIWNAQHSICYLCAERGARSHLLTCLEVGSRESATASAITIATGCEGGWTEAEIEAAIAVGYQPVSLGARILRAVTAPLAALTLIASVFESASESAYGNRLGG
ncbi:MAG: 16S rRNA (uracil(1498)-N(3))-methyltransferase [Drouetiella hepatica Uher 2000/2452]|jgi:16S rRNA (uracil1498-N3)-methyltransferase|uniref:Ribosomal RNA small subunit methyltransferase E n=1 Tax=Drouetiella hepatica Uher 2000/2452 TaxID=904376 RepID=A0A951QFN0_9CYAN|nr:16S rRNA (uracil(1498)-N(3))-methyltransferase [Drouetiella hepatica Uher 2000/2452]